MCVDVIKHVLTRDPTTRASTSELCHIDAVIIHQTSHDRRQQQIARHAGSSCWCGRRCWSRCRCWSRSRSSFRSWYWSRCRCRCRCWSRSRSRCWSRCRCWSRHGTACCTDHRNHRANRNRFTSWHTDFRQSSCDGRRNLRVYFVGGNFKQWLVGGNRVANVLEPTSDGAFGNGFTQLREDDVSHGEVLLRYALMLRPVSDMTVSPNNSVRLG